MPKDLMPTGNGTVVGSQSRQRLASYQEMDRHLDRCGSWPISVKLHRTKRETMMKSLSVIVSIPDVPTPQISVERLKLVDTRNGRYIRAGPTR